MFARAHKFATVFGLCAITVSLFSGCASSPGKVQVSLYDLNYFQPDCARKAEQIAFLQSLRPNANDRLTTISGLSGRDSQVNWTINSHLQYLAQYC